MSITRSHNLMFGLLTALLAAILLTLVGLLLLDLGFVLQRPPIGPLSF